MVAKIHPDNPDLSYGWAFGESNWNTGNDVSLKMIGTLLGCEVISRSITTPPLVANGDRYIVAVGSTGDWAGQDNKIAVGIEGIWEFYGPLLGLPIVVADESTNVVWNGADYQDFEGNAQLQGNLNTPLAQLLSKNNLDFNGGPVITYARGSTATNITRFNLRQALGNDVAAFAANGLWMESAATNEALHSADLTNAVWTKTDGTALMDEAGRDGVVNSASSFTATAVDATVFQTVTKAAVQNTFSITLKRLVGSGSISITQDGGTSFSLVVLTTEYQRFTLVQTVLDPEFGIRVGVIGDSIAVDETQLEQAPFESSYIPTVASTATRVVETLTLPVISNFIPQGAVFSSIVDFYLEHKDPLPAGRYLYDAAATAQRSYAQIDATGDLIVRHGSNDIIALAAANILEDTPYRLVTVFDGVNITVYLNGVSVATGVAGTDFDPDLTDNIFIGSDNAGINQLSANIARVIFDDRAYTVSEARQA